VKVTETGLPGLLLVEPRVFGDERGFFLETWHAERYGKAGVEAAFVQGNRSRSARGVLRGLHYQLGRPQGKLVEVVRGEVFDVAVDIRRGSPTFGEWRGFTLSDGNHLQLYIPEGFAHGFCVLSETADFAYLCTDYYAPEEERGIRWDDPDLAIIWPEGAPTVSEKDRAYPFLKDMEADLPLFDPPSPPGERSG
jgi:dTDP-4-dehydrorhamnose 3,5-epimerase